MAYKDLLVVLDESTRSEARLVLAATLAERFDAHLVGVHVAVGPEPPGGADQFNGYLRFFRPLYEELEEQIRAQAETSRRMFDAIVRRVPLSAEWRLARGYPAAQAALNGRCADLVILGQIDPGDPWSAVLHPAPEEVAMMAGRPILVVPYAGEFVQLGQRVLIGWDASKEATRAVNDAMPLLASASSVTVLTIDAKEDVRKHGDIPGGDIALHLARHNVVVTVEQTASSGIDIGDVLLSRASDLAADLLVMGAYSHSRVRELLLGGATRTVLASATLPVLMAH